MALHRGLPCHPPLTFLAQKLSVSVLMPVYYSDSHTPMSSNQGKFSLMCGLSTAISPLWFWTSCDVTLCRRPDNFPFAQGTFPASFPCPSARTKHADWHQGGARCLLHTTSGLRTLRANGCLFQITFFSNVSLTNPKNH